MFICYIYGFFIKWFIVTLILGCNINLFLYPFYRCKPSVLNIAQSIKINRLSQHDNIFNCKNNFSINRYDYTHRLSYSPKINTNYFVNRNKYSFVPYNRSHTHKSYKFQTSNKINNLSFNRANKISVESYHAQPWSSLHLFRSIVNFFFNEFRGWYVPPIPVGEKTSYVLRSYGPVQSDEESERFLTMVGATKDDDLYVVMAKYKSITDISPHYVKSHIRKLCQEYLRKFLINIFEEMEGVASRGIEAWREFWRPPVDENGKFIDTTKNTPQDLEFLSWFLSEEELSELEELKSPLIHIDSNRYKGLIRFTSDFKKRFKKCLKTMFPLMLMGLVPKLGGISIAASSIVACKIIYQGDGQKKTEKYIDSERYLEPKGKPETLKSLATMMLVGAHSSVGYLMGSLLNHYGNFAGTFFADILYPLFVNMQLTLCALIYDTSEMQYELNSKGQEIDTGSVFNPDLE